jgi:hypothetical protein
MYTLALFRVAGRRRGVTGGVVGGDQMGEKNVELKPSKVEWLGEIT